MKRFLLFTFLCATILSCAQEQTIGPEDNVVTFDRYDAESHFEGTATAWYCTTSTQFDYAVENHGSGDIIILTNDDTVFTCRNSDSNKRKIHGDLIGIGANPSKVKFEVSGSTSAGQMVSDGDNITLSNIYPHHGTTIDIHGDNIDIEGVTDDISYPSCGIRFFGDGDGTITDCDGVSVNMTNSGGADTVYIYSSSWYPMYGTGVCETRITGVVPSDVVIIHSWTYDDTLYSYDDYAFDNTDVYWDTGEDSVTVIAEVDNYNCTGELICGSASCGTTVDMKQVNQSGGTYHWVKVGVGAAQQRFYWRVRSTLCDKSIITSCTMKSRPRNPENGPPDPTS